MQQQMLAASHQRWLIQYIQAQWNTTPVYSRPWAQRNQQGVRLLPVNNYQNNICNYNCELKKASNLAHDLNNAHTSKLNIFIISDTQQKMGAWKEYIQIWASLSLYGPCERWSQRPKLNYVFNVDPIYYGDSAYRYICNQILFWIPLKVIYR